MKELNNKSMPMKDKIGNKNVVLHPPKSVNHEVKYFDPSAAPVITSEHYNLV
jgi:hypothetical protein